MGVTAAVTGRSCVVHGYVEPDLVVVEADHHRRADRDPAERPVVAAATLTEPVARRSRPRARVRAPRRRSRPRRRPSRSTGSSSPIRAGASDGRAAPGAPVEVHVRLHARAGSPACPAPVRASSSAPVPGSLPIETYAATVAARRTSGRAVSDARPDRGPPRPRSTSGRRCREVRIRSRSAIFATAAAEADSLPDRDCEVGTRQAYDRSHEQRRTRPCPRQDVSRRDRPRRDRHLRPLLPPPRARRDRADPRVDDRPARHGVARRRRGRRRGGVRGAADDRRDQAQRRPRHVDGDGPRQDPALRAQGLVVPRRDRPPGAAPAPRRTTPRCR